MHLMISFANCSSGACAAARHSLKLPNLEKLLSRLTSGPLDAGDEFSLSTPHERVLARTIGLPLGDGQIPWAAWEAKATDGAWSFITPCHWRSSAKHVAMAGLTLPDFSADESHALLATMQPYFEEDGITLSYQRSERWLARGELLNGLASASLERVVGRDVSDWLPSGPGALKLRRLQAEMQMLLHNHPVNEARSERGVPVVNSFWLSGSGAASAESAAAAPARAPLLLTALRDAALQEDWAGWAQAWQTLDATDCAALLTTLEQRSDVQLTLCGERHAQTWSSAPTGVLGRLQRMFNQPRVASVLEQL